MEEGESGGTGLGMENSAEFLALRPHCMEIVREPRIQNLQSFEKAFTQIDRPSPHLAPYVLFPFALALKRYSTFRDKVKTKLLLVLCDVFQKFPVTPWQMFIEMYQRLHVTLCSTEDPTKVNANLPEEQFEAAVACIGLLCGKSLSIHFEKLFSDDKIHIVAHSLVVMLQICESDVRKVIRLRALDTIHLYVSKCRKKEKESAKLFRFLPGIISSVRKIVDVRVGRIQLEVFMVGMELLQDAIIVTTAYEDEVSLKQPDEYIAAVLSQISKDVLQSEVPSFRTCLMEVTNKLLVGIGETMPDCRKVLLNNLMVLKTLINPDEAAVISNVLAENVKYITIRFDELLEMMKTALMQQDAKNDSDCLTTLAKLSTYLTLVQLNYFELKEFLDVLFSVMCNEIVNGLRSVQDCGIVDNPALNMCSKICQSLVSKHFQDIFEICEDKLTSFDGNLHSNFLGCVKFMNEILCCQLLTRCQFTTFEVLQLSEHYIELVDRQSTEVVLSILETEAPKLQSLLDVQKAVLLDGLGLMARIYPIELIPVVLYHIIECAGLQYSSIVSETAQQTLKSLAKPKSVSEFLSEHLSSVMCDLHVRILNLSLHPNCPNALIFLANYFDFSQSVMVNLVDSVLSRSCDPFSGGHLQYLYAKVFYAFLVSLWSHRTKQEQCTDPETSISFLSHKKARKKSFLEFLNDHQHSLNLSSAPVQKSDIPIEGVIPDITDSIHLETPATEENNDCDRIAAINPKLSADLDLVEKICHRVLNFLPNSDRLVRLLAMDCLIKGIIVLKVDEDTLLPLAHKTWQNLVPRVMEKDFLVVRKSFELLLCLCSTCGTFLKKRTMDEIFPKLSTLLFSLAMESEQVTNANRKVYTYSQAYKLQLTVLQGLSEICQSIDIQEEELHKVLDGCILYLKPQQHKNLQAAARQLIESLGSENSTTKYRSIWMRLIALGLRNPPQTAPHPSFTPIPRGLIPR